MQRYVTPWEGLACVCKGNNAFLSCLFALRMFGERSQEPAGYANYNESSKMCLLCEFLFYWMSSKSLGLAVSSFTQIALKCLREICSGAFLIVHRQQLYRVLMCARGRGRNRPGAPGALLDLKNLHF